MKSAFVSKHFSCFYFQSRILHFAIWLLFLLVCFLESGSKCRVNEAEIRIAFWFHVFWFTSVCTFFILTEKNCLKGVVDYSTDRPLTHPRLTIKLISTFCTLDSISTFCTRKNSTFLHCLRLIWRVLSQWACWHFCMCIIKH